LPFPPAPGAAPYPGQGYLPASGASYASWGTRALGAIIDYGPIYLLIYLSNRFVIFGLLAIGFFFANTVYRGGKTGQTWGRQVAGSRLVSETTGQPIGPAMAFLRQIAHVVDSVILLIGYFFPLWDSKHQTLADKFVGTIVIEDKTGRQPSS
jgi:uncharacterized RDD family membrane protein YckC